MNQYFFFFLFSIGTLYSSVAQSERISIKNEGVNQYLLSKDIFSFPNYQTEELLILLGDQKDLWVYLYDKNYDKLLDFKIDNNLHGNLDDFLGYSVKGNRYDLIVAKNSMKKFEIFSFDIEKGTLIEKDIDFKFPKKEKYLKSFQVENSFYLLSSDMKSTLFVRKLGDDNLFKLLKEFELTDFADSEMSISLKRLYRPEFLQQINLSFKNLNKASIQTINYKMPSPMSVTSQKTKLYQDDALIHLVMEIEDKFTAIQTIDLKALTMEQKVIPYLEDEVKRYSDHNSYLYKNSLYQISASNEAMILQVKNMQGEVLNEFKLHEKQENIEFANTPILVEGYGYYKYNRELEDPKKFLRKLVKGDIGLNVIKSNNNFIVQIGSNIERGGEFYNLSTPSQWSTYINTMIDQDFQHVSGDIEPTQFDFFGDYKIDMKYKVSSYSFSNKGSVFLGYFNHPTEEFRLIEF